MATEQRVPNGGGDMLATAMRSVFKEAVEGPAKPNENVQSQLAQHREDVRADIQEALKGD